MWEIEAEFNWHSSAIPIISFNRQKYDVNVMKDELLPMLKKKLQVRSRAML